MAKANGLRQVAYDRWRAADKYSRGLHLGRTASGAYACDGTTIALLSPDTDPVGARTGDDAIDFVKYYMIGGTLIGTAEPIEFDDTTPERTRYAGGKQRPCIWFRIASPDSVRRFTVSEWGLTLLSRSWRTLDLFFYQVQNTNGPTMLLQVWRDDVLLGAVNAVEESAATIAPPVRARAPRTMTITRAPALPDRWPKKV